MYISIYRLPQIYEEFYHTINNADHEKDLKWWSNNHGVNMAMNWPQFEVRYNYLNKNVHASQKLLFLSHVSPLLMVGELMLENIAVECIKYYSRSFLFITALILSVSYILYVSIFYHFFSRRSFFASFDIRYSNPMS